MAAARRAEHDVQGRLLGRTADQASNYGGGAIFDQGGQLKVVNSAFLDNRCYAYGPDLGGGAIRAYGMYMSSPVYITHDTFRGNTCSNGAALSGLYANFVVINSLLTANKAIGWGGTPRVPAPRRRQRRRHLHRRRPLQPDHRRHRHALQQRPRGRRRHLLRRQRRRRDPDDQVLDAAPQPERGVPERPRHLRQPTATTSSRSWSTRRLTEPGESSAPHPSRRPGVLA